MAALWQRLLVINYDIFQPMANILLKTKVYFSSCFVFTRWKFDNLPVSSDDIVDVGAGDKKYFIHLTDVLGESHKNRYFTVRLTVRGGF